MRKILNKMLILLCLFFMTITISNKVNAESLSSNKNTVNIGESFTITISGINGKVTVSANDKVGLSNAGTMWVTGQTTISGTAKQEGTGTVTIKLVDATTTGANPKDLSGTTKNINMTVKKKEEVKQETPATPNKTTSTTTSNKTQTNNNKTNTTTNKNNKTETKKETPVVETKEEEEATPLWGISEVKLVGVKENEEKIDLELDKKFDINTYEYSCNVSNEIKKIDIQKEAYEYNEFVTINGNQGDLKEGENIITLKLAKEGQNELVYTIKVNKEEKPEEAVITNTDIVEENKQATEKMITMPIWSFIVLEILLVIAASSITFAVTRIVLNFKNKIKNDNDISNNFEKINN